MNNNFRILPLAVLLATCSGITAAQSVPDSPAPAPDPAWSRLQGLAAGKPIIVTVNDGRSVHCLFANVTDAYLFCNPAGNPPGVGFRFDHADVVGVDLDLPMRQRAQFAQPEHNYHPAWISSMIAGGFIVGLIASRSTDAGTATKAGFIGAGIVGVIGAPLAFLPHEEGMAPIPVARPFLFGAHFTVPFRRK